MHVFARRSPFARAGTAPAWPVLLKAAILAILALAAAPAARAGGGPENLLLVVNPQSHASLTIANHYVHLRHVPSANVIYVPWDPKEDTTDIATFRQRILKPVMEAARSRPNQIDYVVYSSDFPWGIRLDEDRKKFESDIAKAIQGEAEKAGKTPGDGFSKWLKIFTPVGSINGLTYLWEPVLPGAPGYLSLRCNFYVPPAAGPTRAFRSSLHFSTDGKVVPSGGVQYMLSVMLGVTCGRGNSVAEVLDYLRRSAAADGARPKGTIYYCRNDDTRSRARDRGFPRAVRALQGLGVNAEIIEGTLPSRAADVQGAMIGAASFDWKACGSTIRPGAICEHFTSFGGIMTAGAGQTPLSVFLRYGAAGASGTVTEPLAIAAKFPDPMIQVHYARGCTLAEAFYQSVWGPYQLLIVGDPLCRPWANIARVTVAGMRSEATVHGLLALTPAATFPVKAAVERFELFVDGLRIETCRPGATLQLDTALLPDGYHELRVVAVEAGPIQSQGRCILPVVTANHARSVEVSPLPRAIRSGQPLRIAAKAPGCTVIAVFQGNRLLGKIAGPQGRVDIDTAALGDGPVRLRVIGLGGAPRNNVAARPLDVEIEAKE